MERVKKARQDVQEKLRRMAKAYIDGLFPDEEYNRQRRLMEMELASLVVPGANAAEEAGNLIHNLPELWAKANLGERRKINHCYFAWSIISALINHAKFFLVGFLGLFRYLKR